MSGLANIGPMGWLGLAQGLLQPQPFGAGGGAAVGAGLAGMLQGQQQGLQMQRFQRALAKEQETEEALKRLSDPKSYAPKIEDAGTGKGDASFVDLGNPDAVIPPEMKVTRSPYSEAGDMARVAPEAVITARLKHQYDPLDGLPDAMKEIISVGQMEGPQRDAYLAIKAQIDPTGPLAQLQAAGIDPGTPEALHFFMNKGGTRINLNTGDSKQETALAAVAQETINAARTTAEAAFEQAGALARMRQTLRAGLKTGQMSNVRGALAGFITDPLFGGGVSKETADNFLNLTEGADYEAASKAVTAAAIKAFGSNPSNAEREFAQLMGPQIKNNPEAAMRLIDRMFSKNVATISEYGEVIKGLPASSPNANLLRNSYAAKMKTYNKVRGLGARPPGMPEGATYVYEDMDGNDVYQFPDGSYNKWKP